jgi:hypothetical protein
MAAASDLALTQSQCYQKCTSPLLVHFSRFAGPYETGASSRGCSMGIVRLWYGLVVEAVCVVGENTVKGYTKLINKSGAYTEIANTGTDQNRVKE